MKFITNVIYPMKFCVFTEFTRSELLCGLPARKRAKEQNSSLAFWTFWGHVVHVRGYYKGRGKKKNIRSNK